MTRKKKRTKMDPMCAFIVFLVVILVLTVALFVGGRSALKSLYPLRYAEFVEVYSEENNLSPFFVYAVIKCESGFDKDAVSNADARGLMQLLPTSFDWLMTKTGEELSEDMLFDPETSIKYGCLLYGMFIEEFGSEPETVAAYHAGPGNVRKWLKDERYSHDGKTLYEIPFSKTNAYVERVMKTKAIYEKLYS